MADGGETNPRRLKVTPAAAVAVSILVALIAGLSIGKAARPEPVDPTVTRQQALAESGEATLIEVRRASARQGFRDGRKLGLLQGRKSGVQAGRADGRIRSQISRIRTAESAAERAESALAEISEPPPAPPSR